MSGEERLAHVVTALEAVGVSCLVMGGHAVRFYGLSRYTDDFDLHVAPDGWDDLLARLNASPLAAEAAVVEGPSWRPADFRRFRLGALTDGRDEWLDCWRTNHLLAPYPELAARAERGDYGGRGVTFIGLPDLIRCKETERDKDWRDVAVLEVVLDARLLARVRVGSLDPAAALAGLRSRAGFDAYRQAGVLPDQRVAGDALRRTNSPVTQAFLVPYSPGTAKLPPAQPIEPVLVERLRTVEPGSSLHLSLVEIIRRRYIASRKEADRADKEAARLRALR